VLIRFNSSARRRAPLTRPK